MDTALGRRGAGGNRCEGGKVEGERAGEMVSSIVDVCGYMCACQHIQAEGSSEEVDRSLQ